MACSSSECRCPQGVVYLKDQAAMSGCGSIGVSRCNPCSFIQTQAAHAPESKRHSTRGDYIATAPIKGPLKGHPSPVSRVALLLQIA